MITYNQPRRPRQYFGIGLQITSEYKDLINPANNLTVTKNDIGKSYKDYEIYPMYPAIAERSGYYPTTNNSNPWSYYHNPAFIGSYLNQAFYISSTIHLDPFDPNSGFYPPGYRSQIVFPPDPPILDTSVSTKFKFWKWGYKVCCQIEFDIVVIDENAGVISTTHRSITLDANTRVSEEIEIPVPGINQETQIWSGLIKVPILN